MEVFISITFSEYLFFKKYIITLSMTLYLQHAESCIYETLHYTKHGTNTKNASQTNYPVQFTR